MGYFDSMAETCFKRDAQGRALYYPAGILSKGRIIPDDARAKEIQKRLNRAHMIMLPAVITLGATSFHLSWPVFLLLLAIITLGFHLYLRSLASGLEVSSEKLTFREVQASQARTLGRGWLIALVLASALLAVAGLALAIFDPGRELWTGLGTAALFSAMVAVFLVQLRGLGRKGA